jgi:hypothetical protein
MYFHGTSEKDAFKPAEKMHHRLAPATGGFEEMLMPVAMLSACAPPIHQCKIERRADGSLIANFRETYGTHTTWRFRELRYCLCDGLPLHHISLSLLTSCAAYPIGFVLVRSHIVGRTDVRHRERSEYGKCRKEVPGFMEERHKI